MVTLEDQSPGNTELKKRQIDLYSLSAFFKKNLSPGAKSRLMFRILYNWFFYFCFLIGLRQLLALIPFGPFGRIDPTPNSIDLFSELGLALIIMLWPKNKMKKK